MMTDTGTIIRRPARAKLSTAVQVFALLSLTALGGCGDREEAAAEGGPETRGPAPAIEVQTASPVVGEITRFAGFSGEILADTLVEVAPLESGRLVELRVDAGDMVEAGDVIARIDDSLVRRQSNEAGSRVETAGARIDRARAALRRVENDIERRRPLADRGTFPAADFEALQDERAVQIAELSLAEAEHQQARAAASTARSAVDRRVIRAPISGVVAHRYVSVGAMVSPQAPLLTVLDASSLRVVTHLPERHVGTLRPDLPATLEIDAAGEALEARILRVAPQVDRSARTVMVEIALPESALELVRHGMFVRGQVALGRLTDATLIPGAALVDDPTGALVWTVVEGEAQRVPVQVLAREGDTIAVTGVDSASTLVVNPPARLQPGAAVRATPSEPSPQATGDGT